MKFTNSKSYAVRVGDVVVEPGETIGQSHAGENGPETLASLKPKRSTKKKSTPLEPTAPDEVAELSEEDAS